MSNTVTKLKSQIYNISSNSGSLNGSYKSQILINLPDLNFTDESIQNVYLSVLHCEVPNSFYIVNYTCNTLVINSISYTIPVGNYNCNNLITTILSIIPNSFSIVYSSITNKYTWSNSLSNFIINASNSTIRNIIGLGNTDLNSTSLTLICPYVVNFLPLARLNFRSNAFNLANYNQSDGSSDLFLSLQNNAGQQGQILYTAQSGLRFLIRDKTITNILISVTDDFNNLINFNNINWYLTFLIEIEYIEQIKQMSFSSIMNNY